MGPNSVVFDTCVWVAAMNEEDSLHTRAIEVFRANTDTIVLPEYVIVETCTALRHRANKQAADRFLETTLSNDVTKLLFAGEDTIRHSAAFYRSSDHPGLSYVDVFLLFLSQTHRIVTFDKQLDKLIRRNKSGPT